MRKFQIVIPAVLLGMTVFAFAGCTSKKAATTDTVQKAVYATDTPSPKSQILQVYYGDENGEFIISKEVKVASMSGDAITKHLIEAGVLKKSVQLNKMELVDKKGKTVVYLDFNQALQDQVGSMGSAGERIIMGSLTNTFLKAQSASKIKLTIEGNPLETGDNVYDTPLTWYKPIPKTTLTVKMKNGKKVQNVDVRRNYCENGLAYNYDDTNFKVRYSAGTKTLTLLSKKSFTEESPDGYLKATAVTGSMAKEAAKMKASAQKDKTTTPKSVKVGQDKEFMARWYNCSSKKDGCKKMYYLIGNSGKVWKIELGSRNTELQKRLQLTVDSLHYVK